MEFDFISLRGPFCARCYCQLKDGKDYFYLNGELYCGRLCLFLAGHSGNSARKIRVFNDESDEPSIAYPDDPYYDQLRGKHFG